MWGFCLNFTELNGRGLISLMLRETGPEPPIFMSQLGHGFAPRLVCCSVLPCLSREGVRPGTEAAADLIRDITVTSSIPAADGCRSVGFAQPLPSAAPQWTFPTARTGQELWGRCHAFKMCAVIINNASLIPKGTPVSNDIT